MKPILICAVLVLAAAPAAAQAAPSPTRCRAMADVLAESYQSILEMSQDSLASDRDQTATADDKARWRQSVDDATDALAVIKRAQRRYASAPAADAALTKELNNTVIKVMLAELKTCP